MELIAIGVIIVVLLWRLVIRRVTVFEYERAMLYRGGKFHRILEPGAHWLWRYNTAVHKVDMRAHTLTIPGQEVLTADNLSIKISVAVQYKITDPYRALMETIFYNDALYQQVQIHLRDLVGALLVDDLLAQRAGLSATLLERARPDAEALGLTLQLTAIKDIMFPGGLKEIFAQAIKARYEGLAALERARGESAALRNLANAARLLENNPALAQLRLLQTLGSSSGHTVILASSLDDARRAMPGIAPSAADSSEPD